MPADSQSSNFQRIQLQAQVALRRIQTEIRNSEGGLVALREREQMLRAFIGGKTRRRAPVPKSGSGQRVDWSAVVSKLPKQFTATDVRKVRGLSNKRPSEIFAAITRWIEAKMAKRKERGLYERVG